MSKITSCYWIVDSSFFLYCEEVTKKGRPPVIGNSCLSLHSPAGLRNSLCSNSPRFFYIFPPRYYQPLRVRAITRRGIPDFTSPAGDVSRPHSKIIRCHSEPRPMVECEESPLSIFLAIVAIALSLYRRFFGTLNLRMAIMSSRT